MTICQEILLVLTTEYERDRAWLKAVDLAEATREDLSDVQQALGILKSDGLVLMDCDRNGVWYRPAH